MSEPNTEKFILLNTAHDEKWKDLEKFLNKPKFYSICECDQSQNTILHILAAKNLGEYLHLISLTLDKTKDLIQINERNLNGNTPLHLAVKHNHLENTKIFIRNGAGVNLLNKYGHSPLYYATINGNMKMVQLLYSTGCEINYKDRNGDNVVHLAARLNYKLLIAFFGKKNFDLNSQNKSRQTPLEVAIESNNSEIALVLLTFNCNVQLCNTQRDGSLLHKSVQHGNAQVTSILMKIISIHSLDNELRTPLHVAVEAGNLEIVKILLKQGADLNIPDGDGYTPLHIVVQNGYLDILDVFIDYAKPEVHKSGSSELSKEEQVVNLKKLDYFKVTNAGDNILHLLAASLLDEQLKMEVFYVLLKFNLKKLVVMLNKDFKTPLHFANNNFNRALVTKFISLGADIHEVDRFGLKPRDYCTMPGGGRTRVIKKESFSRSYVRSIK